MASLATQDGWSHEAASRHPVAARLLRDHGPVRLGAPARPGARFRTLARSICHQQLAGAAAGAIWGRTEALLGGDVTPEAVTAAGEDALRSCGLSGAKATTILGLAEAVQRGEVQLERMGRLPDQAVVDQLTVVRGIGRWTAEMFLMFTLHRPDVWPTGDLGVRIGYGMAFGLDDPPTPKALESLGDGFASVRSTVAWWCWREVEARRAAAT